MIVTQPIAPRQPRQRVKPARSIRLCIKPEGVAPGIIRLTVGKDTADYFITIVSADFGQGFLVEKFGIDRDTAKYHVNIDGEKRSCECKGFLHHGKCKHADGIAALIARGQL